MGGVDGLVCRLWPAGELPGTSRDRGTDPLGAQSKFGIQSINPLDFHVQQNSSVAPFMDIHLVRNLYTLKYYTFQYIDCAFVVQVGGTQAAPTIRAAV